MTTSGFIELLLSIYIIAIGVVTLEIVGAYLWRNLRYSGGQRRRDTRLASDHVARIGRSHGSGPTTVYRDQSGRLAYRRGTDRAAARHQTP